MTVVVQPAFLIKVLTLEAQRVVDFAFVEAADLAVGAVVRGPDDFAAWLTESSAREYQAAICWRYTARL